MQFQKIDDLIQIMDRLLAPDGCPWDREQTPQTLAPYAIEEAYELAEALDKGSVVAIKEELGDLLLQVVFHCALAKRDKAFTLEDVIDGICTKLIRRHPHVFANLSVSGAEEVLKNWNQIKANEKKEKGEVQQGFGIPVNMPALQRAQKIGEKTKTLKFDWLNSKDVLAKVDEELGELKEALKSQDGLHIAEELGDVFFVLAQLSRHLKLEAETVARKANQKFETRFSKMTELAAQRGKDFVALTSDEKESLWEEVKRTSQ
jgi:MazG family protein